MKKLILVFILVVSTIFFSSCEFRNIETADRIKPPNNNTPPISGRWKIEGYKKSNEDILNEKKVRELLNKEIIFHKKVAVIGNDLCLNPSYKIKNVDSSDYLLYQYKVKPEYLNIKSKKVQIVTLTSEEKFFYEFIKEDDDKIIIKIDGGFFYLTKISDELKEEDLEKYIKDCKKDGNNHLADKGDEGLKSGVLLGLRYRDNSQSKDEMEGWKYRTIWIASENKSLDRIYGMEDLFLPRKTGFWKVGVDKTDENSKESLYAYSINKEPVETESLQEIKEIAKNSVNTIVYIGNDYISLEYVEDFPAGKTGLETLPIDNMRSDNSIKISDITGENGKQIFYESATKEFSSDRNVESEYLDIKPNEESFGLARKNGHWIMKGRLNFLEGNKDVYKDFNIKIIPPKELVLYDELAVSWNAIKLKVPDAVDAFTSPNEDIALIFTPNKILTYAIEKGKLAKKPLRELELNDSETVVMAEWATGKYVDRWEKEFLKNNAFIIQE